MILFKSFHCKGMIYVLQMYLVVVTLLTTAVNSLGHQINRTSEFYGLSGLPRDCSDIDIKRGSGLYKIYPKASSGFNVYCEMDIDNVNGGWTVFQRRLDGEVYFFRNWAEYKAGFGNLNKEFWLGNDKLHILTSHGDYELMIVLWDFSNNNRYAKYTKFRIGNEAANYKLSFGKYSGNAGDGLGHHNGRQFTTKDRDNDAYTVNCATEYKGAWWYGACHDSNLNGLYLNGKHSSHGNGINWEFWLGNKYSLKSTVMMIRKT